MDSEGIKLSSTLFEDASKCLINIVIWDFTRISRSQIQSVNPFPYKPWFIRVCSTSLLKTQWEKEKLLIMSNFYFSDSVLYLFGEYSAIFTKHENVIPTQ